MSSDLISDATAPHVHITHQKQAWGLRGGGWTEIKIDT